MKFKVNESSHWYDQEGSPCYEVSRKDGRGMRPTTLADAKKLGLVPSVTSVMSIRAKPQVEVWKQNHILETVCKNYNIPKPPIRDLARAFKSEIIYDWYDESYLENIMIWKNYVIKQTEEVLNSAAKRGTQIHDQLEKFFLGKKVPAKYSKYINAVNKELSKYEFFLLFSGIWRQSRFTSSKWLYSRF